MASGAKSDAADAHLLTLLGAPHPSQRVYDRPGAQAQERVHAALATAAANMSEPRCALVHVVSDKSA
jgi:hypothetical protein